MGFAALNPSPATGLLLQGYYYRVTTTGLLQGYRGESPEWIYALELEKDRRFPFARCWRSDALSGFQRPRSRLRPDWQHYVNLKARPAEQAVRSAQCVPGCNGPRSCHSNSTTLERRQWPRSCSRLGSNDLLEGRRARSFLMGASIFKPTSSSMAPVTEGHNASIVEFVPELDRLAADVMAGWKGPGAALAVVQDGKVTLTKAYGQRDVEANLPVIPTTQFLICS